MQRTGLQSEGHWRQLNLISQGGEGKEWAFPGTQHPGKPGCRRSRSSPPGGLQGGCPGGRAGEGAAWGRTVQGAAGCSVTQRCRMSVGSRPSSQMLCKGLSSGGGNVRSPGSTYAMQERPDFAAPLPFPPCLPALRSLQPRSHPPSPPWEASIHFTPLEGKAGCSHPTKGEWLHA